MKQTYMIGPERTVQMDIFLEENGRARILLAGPTKLACWCGQAHHFSIRAELYATHHLGGQDLTDLEMAIRGQEEGALRLGWKIVGYVYERSPQSRSVHNPQEA